MSEQSCFEAWNRRRRNFIIDLLVTEPEEETARLKYDLETRIIVMMSVHEIEKFTNLQMARARQAAMNPLKSS